MKLSAPLYRLKRHAKRLARAQNIPLHEALDAIARREGLAQWSLLSAQHHRSPPAARLYAQLHPGDLLLLAARPGQGKTMLGLELAVQAMRVGHQAHFYTLEYTNDQAMHLVSEVVQNQGEALQNMAQLFNAECSEDICAAYITQTLVQAQSNSLVVIDYLQQLDLKRIHPPLQQQVSQLRQFAQRRGLIMVFIAQVEREFELAAHKLPGLSDVRLPNPLDLKLFDTACFLGDGEIEICAVA